MKKKKTLAELKGESVVLRDGIEAEEGTLQDVLDLNEKNRAIRSIEAWLLVITACLMLAMSGCTTGATLGVSSSVYYPKKWESPASRRQYTQPTVGMARNNLPMVNGGAK